jgi:hypothetical protein
MDDHRDGPDPERIAHAERGLSCGSGLHQHLWLGWDRFQAIRQRDRHLVGPRLGERPAGGVVRDFDPGDGPVIRADGGIGRLDDPQDDRAGVHPGRDVQLGHELVPVVHCQIADVECRRRYGGEQRPRFQRLGRQGLATRLAAKGPTWTVPRAVRLWLHPVRAAGRERRIHTAAPIELPGPDGPHGSREAISVPDPLGSVNTIIGYAIIERHEYHSSGMATDGRLLMTDIMNRPFGDPTRLILGPAIHDQSLTPRQEGWKMVRGGIWNARGLISGLVVLSVLMEWGARRNPQEPWVGYLMLGMIPIWLVAMYVIPALAFRIGVGLFQMAVGIRYVAVERWFHALPWWGKALVFPLLAAVSTALVMGIVMILWLTCVWLLGLGKR